MLKQEVEQNVDQFVQNIKTDSGDCEFQSVLIQEYWNDTMCNVLIVLLQSNSIRTKFLEQTNLNFQTAHNVTGSLKVTQKNDGRTPPRMFRILLLLRWTASPIRDLLVRQAKRNQPWLLYTESR